MRCPDSQFILGSTQQRSRSRQRGSFLSRERWLLLVINATDADAN